MSKHIVVVFLVLIGPVLAACSTQSNSETVTTSASAASPTVSSANETKADAANSSASEEDETKADAANSSASESEPANTPEIPTRFVLPEPYPSIDWCTEDGGSGCPLGHPKQMVNDETRVVMLGQLLDLGYRLASQEFPSVFDRNPQTWLSLSPFERSNFLDVVLWNYIARLSIDDGVQYRTEAEIGADFDYVVGLSLNLADTAQRNSAEIPAHLQAAKDGIVIDAGQPEWFAEWLLNGAVVIGVPGLAPEAMSAIDDSVRFTSR